MKVIDLLVKIANGEEIENFRIPDRKFEENRDDIFEYHNGQLRNDTCGKWLEVEVGIEDWEEMGFDFLNKEVEIIEEEKKINKLLGHYEGEAFNSKIQDKINEIIEVINGRS